jgi:hypothetical protein
MGGIWSSSDKFWSATNGFDRMHSSQCVIYDEWRRTRGACLQDESEAAIHERIDGCIGRFRILIERRFSNESKNSYRHLNGDVDLKIAEQSLELSQEQ